jgi:hypothetical protein
MIQQLERLQGYQKEPMWLCMIPGMVLTLIFSDYKEQELESGVLSIAGAGTEVFRSYSVFDSGQVWNELGIRHLGHVSLGPWNGSNLQSTLMTSHFFGST